PTAPNTTHTLSLHDALPISLCAPPCALSPDRPRPRSTPPHGQAALQVRSDELREVRHPDQDRLQLRRTRAGDADGQARPRHQGRDRKSTRLNSSHVKISYAV